MGGLFDRIQKRIDEIHAAEEQGISPLHLVDLPPEMRRIMRLLLREVELTYPEIQAEVQEWPADQQLDDERLQATLDELTRQNWLIKMGAGEVKTYTVNLRRRAGSQLVDVWGSLNSRIDQFAAEVKQKTAEGSPPTED